MASKTAGFSAISGGIGAVGGAVVLGGGAALGRNTIGRGANWVSETQREKLSQSRLGRAGLWMADKGKGASFESRNILGKVPGLNKEVGILGKGGGKGGFAETIKKRAEKQGEYGKKVYGQTAAESEEAKRREAQFDVLKTEDEGRIKSERQQKAEQVAQAHTTNVTAIDEYVHEQTKTERETYETENKGTQAKEEELERMRQFGTASQISNSERELEQAREKAHSARELIQQKRIHLETKDEQFKKLREEAVKSSEAQKAAQAALKQDVNESEYSKDVKEAKEAWLAKKEAGKRRLQQFAYRQEEGPLGLWTKLGLTDTDRERRVKRGPAGARATARKVRDIAEDKDKKGKKKNVQELAEEFGLKIKFDDDESGSAPSPSNPKESNKK